MKKILSILILNFSVLFVSAQVNLSSSLTACYGLDGNVIDLVSSLNGTATGVTTTSNRFNTANAAYSFSGTNTSFIELPANSLLKPSAISVSAWVKIQSFIGADHIIFTNNGNGSSFAAYSLITSPASGVYTFRTYKEAGGGSAYAQSTTTLSTNTWYHIVFTIDNTALNLYVNGALESTVASTLNLTYQAGKGVILGGTNEWYNTPFNGSLDNVRFYDRILNASEVSSLYLQDPTCGAPISSFSVFPPGICAGGTVALTDLSSNTPTSWSWQTAGAVTNSTTVHNPVLTFTSAGVYSISLVATNTVGVGSTAMQTITVLANPTISISATPTICAGQSTTLAASGATSYVWSTSQTGAQITINPTQSATYTVIGQGANGCFNSAQKSLGVDPLPILAVTGASVVCAGSTASAQVTSGTAISYTWANGMTTSFIQVIPIASGVHTVTGSDSYGCTNTATFGVTVNPLPVISVSGNSTVCQGLPTTLLVTGNAFTYTWSTNTTGNLITVAPTISTSYTVLGTDANGCVGSATQFVFVNSLPSVMVNANVTTACAGDPVILSGIGASSYAWSGGVINNVAFYPNASAAYTVTGIGSNGCKNSTTIVIIVNSLPVLSHSVNPVSSVCAGEPVTLSVGGANMYNWSTGEVMPTIVITPTANTNYTVTGIDANGCKGTYVFAQIVNACVGLQEQVSENSLKVYPNPTSGKITLDGSEGNMEFEVFDLLGTQLFKGKISGKENSISIENYPKGIYFIKLKSERSEKTIRIVKE